MSVLDLYEVESAVLSHESVSNCAITAYPDEIRGQIVKKLQSYCNQDTKVPKNLKKKFKIM